MKKGLLIIILLLSCFWFANVKAEDSISGIDPQNDTNEVEKGDELDPVVEDVAHDKNKDVHRTCIQFIDTSVNPSYNVSSSSCAATSGSKISKALKTTSFSYGNKFYEFDGWYDEAGNKVTTYYNGNETRIKVSYTYDKDKCQVLKYYLKWKETVLPIFHFVVDDYISDGDVNTTYYYAPNEGGTYTHSFYKAPSTKNHYSFLYWKVEDSVGIYNVGDKFYHDVANQGLNTEVTITGEAYWKADVTLNLYDGNKLLSTQSDFTSVSINSKPEKIGYEFLGWKDENGNSVTEETFYPEAIGAKPNPVVVNLYADWKQIKMDLDVTKIWDDEDNIEGFRPEEITVELFADGVKVDEVTFKGEGNKWVYTFKDLVKFNTEKEIVYTVREVSNDKYGTEVEGFTITNHRDVEKIDLTVKKEWDDADNQDGIRPKEVVYTLSNGDTITLNEANNWEGSIKGLIKNANGKEIEYSWTEASVEGYKLTNVSVNDYITIFTNTHTPEVTNVIVNKVWADDNNASGKRPESITITLIANDKEIKTIDLTSASEWKHIFNDLPVYSNGNKITYNVVEKEIPEGYEVSYEGDMNEGFTVHNVLGQGEGEIEEPKTNNPQTGDNIIMYLVMLLISTAGIISGKLYIKNN